MVSREDARRMFQIELKNPTEEDVDTAVDLKNPQKDIVEWSKMDEELRVAHNRKIENSQKPTMWEYNPKGGVPTELVNLDPSTFLTSRQGRILCFLPKDALARICSMLSVRDFLDLSLTCRFLHWRMFTFCTCYTSHTVKMRIEDWRIDENFYESTDVSMPNMMIYFLSLDDFRSDQSEEEEEEEEEEERMQLYFLRQEGQRGLYVCQPFCLRKPFFFDTLELILSLPFYGKRCYDMCLLYIMNVRCLARHLNLTMFYPDVFNYCAIDLSKGRLFEPVFRNESSYKKGYYNFSDTNDFFKTINVTCYSCYIGSRNRLPHYFRHASKGKNLDIYINCPYARQMNIVYIPHWFLDASIGLNVPVFENSIGQYWTPLDSAIIATLKNFLTGSTNLILHRYRAIKENNGRFPLMEYLFQEFGKFEETFYAPLYMEYTYFVNYKFYIWEKVVATENGGQLRIVIKKHIFSNSSCVTIGKNEMFDEMLKKYGIEHPYRKGNFLWKMETAVEPDEVKELNEGEESDKAEESDDVEKSNEAEEEQRASNIFCCVNNNCCTVQ